MASNRRASRRAAGLVALLGCLQSCDLKDKLTPSTATACSDSPTGKGGRMCRVPAGTFKMGCNAAVDPVCGEPGASPLEKPLREVELAEFWIDEHEVTAGEFKQCVDAGACTYPVELTHFSCTAERTNHDKPDRVHLPMNCVDWDRAEAYCAWAGKRLPSEAEWEKAARGIDGRPFPWGNARVSCAYAVIEDACGLGRTAEVCSKPEGRSPYGACDMVGNVKEWTTDRFDGTKPTANSLPPNPGPARVVRGGSWRYDGVNYTRASAREHQRPSTAWDNLGFRCAASG